MSCQGRGFVFFFFNDTATTEIYTLSLHDALPILPEVETIVRDLAPRLEGYRIARARLAKTDVLRRVSKPRDRKSTRLNSSHSQISYAVFCLKKKRIIHEEATRITSPSSVHQCLTS